MDKALNTQIPIFCPCPECEHYQSQDNKITKDGVYRTKSDSTPRQMLYCHGGQHRFSETRYSDVFHKQGSFKEYEQAAKMSNYGLSIEQIADVLNRDIRTVTQWLTAIAKKSNQFHLFICLAIQLNLLYIQFDEIWSYLMNKGKSLWVFIALEANTKFWIGFELGSRSVSTANRMILQVKRFGNWCREQVVKITTDKLAAYKNALAKHFVDIPYHYLQIVKKRIKRRLVTVKKCFVTGTEQDFPEKTQNTSFIERFNLTLRQRVSYLARKTLGYCKNKSNFNCILWINLYDYNYIRFHKSLREKVTSNSGRFERKYHYCTPAMKMGLTLKPLQWRYLLTAPIPITN